MHSLVELVQRFRGVHALVIGDAMLDSYLEGTAARLCSEGPVPVVRKTAEQRAPGGAANSAANLRALGADVTFVGLVGDDLAGTLLRRSLHAHDLDDSWLVQDAALGTLHKLRILADEQYVVRFDEGETRRHAAATAQALIERIERAFPRCDLIVLADYCYGAVSDALIARLRELRRNRPIPLVVDSKDLRRFRQAGASIVTPNHLEARLAVDPAAGEPVQPTPAALEPVGRRLLELIDAEHVAITMAAQGVLLLDRSGAVRHLPARPVAQAHDVGAGDTFTAALALGLAAGASSEQAAQLGIEAAGIVIGRRRTAVVRQQELLQRAGLLEHIAAQGLASGETTLARLAEQLATARRDGQIVVFTNGLFDLLHAGHVQFLRQARALGDILVVGVNSDRSAKFRRGQAPASAERDRLALVSALEPVDYALLFDETTPAELIRVLRPQLHVKGGDYAAEDLPEAEAVREVGGQIVILPLAGHALDALPAPAQTALVELSHEVGA